MLRVYSISMLSMTIIHDIICNQCSALMLCARYASCRKFSHVVAFASFLSLRPANLILCPISAAVQNQHCIQNIEDAHPIVCCAGEPHGVPRRGFVHTPPRIHEDALIVAASIACHCVEKSA
jgi:hypothetical protein